MCAVGGSVLRKKYWFYLFILAAIYGSVGEIVINTIATILRGQPLFLYYNGWSTSWEAFILFGFAGCLAFYLYLKALAYRDSQKIVIEETYGEIIDEIYELEEM